MVALNQAAHRHHGQWMLATMLVAAWLPSVPGYTYTVLLDCVDRAGQDALCSIPTMVTGSDKAAAIALSGFDSSLTVGSEVDLSFGDASKDYDDWFDDDDAGSFTGNDAVVVDGSGDEPVAADTDDCMGLLGGSDTCKLMFGLSGRNPFCCSCEERSDLVATAVASLSTVPVGIESNCTWESVVGSSPANAEEIGDGPLVDTTDGGGCLSCCKFMEGTITTGAAVEPISTCIARMCDGDCKFLLPNIVNATTIDEAECSDDQAIVIIIVFFSLFVILVLLFTVYFAYKRHHDDDSDRRTKIDSDDEIERAEPTY